MIVSYVVGSGFGNKSQLSAAMPSALVWRVIGWFFMTYKISPLDVSDLPNYPRPCPFCTGVLECRDFLLPGFKALGSYCCVECGGTFFGDLPSSYGMFDPVLYSIEKETVFGGEKLPFWRQWTKLLHSSGQKSSPLVTFVEIKKIRKPAILNCLEKPYGHMLIKLFQSEHYLEHFSEYDLILIIPSSMAWLVPEGLAGIIRVDWSTEFQDYWCHSLVNEVNALQANFPSLHFCPTLPNPDANKINITKYTGTEPFERGAWSRSLVRPTVVFIWRDDRTWSANDSEKLKGQVLLINSLAKLLLQFFPRLNFNVAGFCENKAPLSEGINDLRCDVYSDEMERSLCALYASAQVVVGVHGSNMILPSALAGATVELVPPGRWHNAWTASFSRNDNDSVATMLYNRFVPTSIAPDDLAQLVRTIMIFSPWGQILGMKPNCDIGLANPDELRDAVSKLQAL